ncbi:hypothetical protein SAMN05444422_101491 [Halobiforma haloterrestris]|uniref:Uncharacterized protein n=1 Tax=Natronobacterium haloterrestre TaxID=148448 RepID=A0A1I1DC67_NATHA|nr:hypothetical protein [Halobiforma haloterrestris]SFB72394.1 hypothetical protein SAMN05444422_101491 [Halobiforma haloterrestris]
MGGRRDADDGRWRRHPRRTLLRAVGTVGAVSALGGVGSAVRSRTVASDADADGIPDHRKRSAEFHARLESIFGSHQFEGLEPGRRDLLIDVRYVGDATISTATERTIVDLFRDNGIHAQWLEYPRRYDLETVADRYGLSVGGLLWGVHSFYREEIEPSLEDVALQLIVVPGTDEGPYEGRIYSRWMDLIGGGLDRDGYVNGFSLGNRAVVTDRDDREAEARLVLHELAHLALCHADDPANDGVMGTGDRVDLTDGEWAELREGLSNVRDGTGYDFLFRPCLWDENLAAILD